MDYLDMVRKIHNLDLESLAHGIKVQELKDPPRFEAAGLGIIHMNMVEYYGPCTEIYRIYSGSWENAVKTIVSSSIDDKIDPYGEYYKMVKSIADMLCEQNRSGSQFLGLIRYKYKNGVNCKVFKDKLGELYLILHNPNKRDIDRAGELGFDLANSMRKDLPQFIYYKHDGYKYILSNEGVSSGTPESYDLKKIWEY